MNMQIQASPPRKNEKKCPLHALPDHDLELKGRLIAECKLCIVTSIPSPFALNLSVSEVGAENSICNRRIKTVMNAATGVATIGSNEPL
jgi:hypothetical protein